MVRASETLGLGPGNPWRSFTLGLLVIFGLAVAFAAVIVAFEPIWALIAAIIAAAVLVSLCVIVPFGRVYERGMRRLLAGEAWVRWRFDGAEWEAFSAQELARSRTEAKIGVAISSLLAILIGFIAALSGGSGETMLLAGGLVLGVGWLVSLGILVAGRVRYARRRGEVGDVTIGPLGVYHPGRWRDSTCSRVRWSWKPARPRTSALRRSPGANTATERRSFACRCPPAGRPRRVCWRIACAPTSDCPRPTRLPASDFHRLRPE